MPYTGQMISGHDIRAKYLAYMERNGHTVIPSSPLVPENDPTTLFTSSGMQPLIPYLMGEDHPVGTRLVNSQKCFRAEDIEEVGDNRHTTFFEMLGNWSLGDYFKREQIPWIYNFLIDEVGIDPNKLYVTVFAGDDTYGIPKDTESVALWQKLFTDRNVTSEVAHIGSEEDGGKRGMQEGERIFYYDAKKNWWSRSGRPEKMPLNEIGGPDTEMFYDFGTPHDTKFGEHCHPNCDCGRFMEIGNSVFIEYIKKSDAVFEKLPKQNVDFGGGLERITAAANNTPDVFAIDLLATLISALEKYTAQQYTEHTHSMRVVADHIRGAVFMIADGIHPSNTEQGYFVRRLIRRAIRYIDTLTAQSNTLAHLVPIITTQYGTQYPQLGTATQTIVAVITDEEAQFRKTLAQGLKILNKILTEHGEKNYIDGETVFTLFTTYGFPMELTEEIAQEHGCSVDRADFSRRMDEHRTQSRAGADQKFKGGLADNSEKVIMYHTVTHLLLAALRKELGTDVHQAGSNITEERLRFDFTYPERVPSEILTRIESYVNNALSKSLRIDREVMSKTDARNDPTIEGSFWEKYPESVYVYTARDSDDTIYSRELCGGPHVESTKNITGTFKIIKEESSAAGVRRIKAVLA